MSDERFKEPEGGRAAASGKITPQPSGYERYMAAQGIPIHEAPGFSDVRQVELGDWSRRGVRGAFLVLDQLLHQLGMFVLEIPPGGATSIERHLYEERYWVVEGEGTTEVFPDGGSPRRFEWHTGSLFALPLNMPYRLVNAGDSRVVLISGNYAPRVIDIFEDADFVFGTEYSFPQRYNGATSYFTPNLETVTTPESGRALWRTSIIPDIIGCELPLDNVRTPGYRRIELKMSNGNFWGFIGEFPSGRYSRAHYHTSGAALVCVKGRGFSYAWPKGLGTTPWKDGHADQVSRVDYGPGGVIAAAPGAGDWFHQHFSVGSQPLRMLQYYGGLPGGPYHKYAGKSGKNQVYGTTMDKGGNQIPYPSEDPHIREEYQRMLAIEGVEMDMPDGIDVPGGGF